jgi:hypothetical protein
MSTLSENTAERGFYLRSWCSKMLALVPLPCRQRKRMFLNVITTGIELSCVQVEATYVALWKLSQGRTEQWHGWSFH